MNFTSLINFLIDNLCKKQITNIPCHQKLQPIGTIYEGFVYANHTQLTYAPPPPQVKQL